MRNARIYNVPRGCETPDEPRAGFYWWREDEEGNPVIRGPYLSRSEAEGSIERDEG